MRLQKNSQSKLCLAILWIFTFSTISECVAFPSGSNSEVSALISKAESGDAKAQANLAWIYWYGIGIDENPFQAYKWAKKSESGSIVSKYILAVSVGEWGAADKSVSRENIFNEISSKIQKIDIEKDSRLKLIKGVLVKVGYIKDAKRSDGLSLIMKASDAGDPAAQVVLSNIFYSGDGVLKNEELARDYALKSSKKDCTRALKLLSRFLSLTAEESDSFIQRAADLGDVESQSILIKDAYLNKEYQKVLLLTDSLLQTSAKNYEASYYLLNSILLYKAKAKYEIKDYPEALDCYQKILSNTSSMEDYYLADYIYIYQSIGSCLKEEGKLDKALTYYDKALNYLKKIDLNNLKPFKMGENRSMPTILNTISNDLMTYADRNEESLVVIDVSLSLVQKMNPLPPSIAASCYYLKSKINFNLGNRDEAFLYSKKIIDIIDISKANLAILADPITVDTYYRNHAFLCTVFKDYELAIEYRKIAIQHCEKYDLQFQKIVNKTALLDLESIYQNQHIDIELYISSVQQLESGAFKNININKADQLISRLSSRIAQYFMLVNDLETAKKWAEKGMRFSGDSIGSKNFSKYMLSQIYFDTGEQKEGLSLARELIESESQYLRKVDVLALLLKMHIRSGQDDEAKKTAKELKIKYENDIINTFGILSDDLRWKYLKGHDFYSAFASLDMIEELAEAVLRFKGIGIASLLEDQQKIINSEDPEVISIMNEIYDYRKKIIREDVETSVLAKKKNDSTVLLRNKYKDLQSELLREIYKGEDGRIVLKANAFDIRANLNSGSVLIDYITYDDLKSSDKVSSPLLNKDTSNMLGAVIFTRSNDPIWVPIASSEDVNQLIKEYLPNIKSKRNVKDSEYISTLNQLYQKLILPVLDRIDHKPDTLIISPDGYLNNLNFSVLLDDSNKFLCESFVVKYVSASRDVINSVLRNKPKSPVMAIFSNPAFGGDNSDGSKELNYSSSKFNRSALSVLEDSLAFSPLLGAKKESDYLYSRASTWNIDAQLYSDVDASESNLYKLKAPYVLHFATHGYFLSGSQKLNKTVLKNPMYRSGLVLAGAKKNLRQKSERPMPNSNNDGILTAAEASLLDLNGTWLVSLSACDSGRGEIVGGEGVMGLRRAFIQAGAKNILMTLWPVSDKYTAEFIQSFYETAMKSGDAPLSLSNVQRNLLVKHREKFKSTKQATRLAVQLAGPFILSFQGKP